ncbi:MAG: FadR/GntR family transcriptional regulator [Jatrophihabitans sp.]
MTTPMGKRQLSQATPAIRPRQHVEQQIRQAILSGEFGQGDKLPTENDLAESLGVSRPTVREALQSLVAVGLIDKVPGVSGGSFVRSVNHHALGRTMRESMANILQLGTLDIGEVHAMRRLLEVPAAQLAAVHREDKHLDAMAEVVDHQRSTTLDDPNIPELDQRFHTTIAEASGNRLLSAFISSLHVVSQPARFLELTPEVGRCTVRQHMAIQHAIEAQNERAAQAAMIEHLDYVLLNSSPDVDGPRQAIAPVAAMPKAHPQPRNT